MMQFSFFLTITKVLIYPTSKSNKALEKKKKTLAAKIIADVAIHMAIY